MPYTSSPGAERRDRIARLDRLSQALDTRFRIPGIGLRVGWDSIFGLVPVIGDVVTAGPGVAMILEGARIGARKRALVRMGANTGIDMLIGGIPVMGDVFDALFKSHRRNIKILKKELARIETRDAAQAPDSRHHSRRDKKRPAGARCVFNTDQKDRKNG